MCAAQVNSYLCSEQYLEKNIIVKLGELAFCNLVPIMTTGVSRPPPPSPPLYPLLNTAQLFHY